MLEYVGVGGELLRVCMVGHSGCGWVVVDAGVCGCGWWVVEDVGGGWLRTWVRVMVSDGWCGCW